MTEAQRVITLRGYPMFAGEAAALLLKQEQEIERLKADATLIRDQYRAELLAESGEPVAYRHLHEDGWEYYDAPTGEDCEGCKPLYTESQLAAAVLRYKEDAERYRWLKTTGKNMSVDYFNGHYRVVDSSVNLVITDWCDSFDAAIDAARSQGANDATK